MGFGRQCRVVRNSPVKQVLTALIILALGLNALRAGFEIFLEVPNAPGEAVERNHKDWIDILSFSHTMNRTAQLAPALHSSLYLEKRLDKASPNLALFCSRGDVLPSAQIDFIRNDQTAIRFYQINLSNALVTVAQSSGGSGGNAVYETIGLNYHRIEWTYREVSAVGAVKGTHSSFWNLVRNFGGLGREFYVGFSQRSGNTGTLSWSSIPGKTYLVLAAGNIDGQYENFRSISTQTAQTSIDVPFTATLQFFRVIEQ